MTFHRVASVCRVFVPAVLLVLTFSLAAEARVARRAAQPAPPTQPLAAARVAPAGVVAAHRAPAICCPRNICYRHHPGCGCYDPCRKMDMILQVKDPCACCLVEVPVCIPACCTTSPTVCNYKGFLRRQVVEYSWACGFKLKVVFDRCGDITVHYYGV